MPSQATITGKTGPAVTVTSLVLTGVTEMLVQAAPKSVLQITHDKGISHFDLNATTTFTVTIAAGVITVAVSQ